MSFTAWDGTLAFGPWWLLRCGPLAPTEARAHHAITVVVHGGAPCITDADGEPVPGPVAVIGSDHRHTIHAHRDHTIVLYVEPDSTPGRQLTAGTSPSVSTPTARLGRGHPVGEILGNLRPSNWSRADEAVRRTLAYVFAAPADESIYWWRHPSFDEALTEIAGAGECIDRIDTEQVAERVGVPTDRLAQLFPGEVGIDLEPYARWLRLVRANEQLAVGDTLDAAALAAGFADAAHLDRAMTQMFGFTAGHLAASARWIQ